MCSCAFPACPGAPCVLQGPRGAPAPNGTLVESLGSTVDSLRQLYTDFGIRPYRVFSVAVKWSGGSVGRGTASVLAECEFLPTPLLQEWSVRGAPRSGGLPERGDARLSQISPLYTEDQIRSLSFCPAQATLPTFPRDIEGFIEVRMGHRDPHALRRRFTIAGPPYRSADGFEWRVKLLRQDQDRSRDGVPYGSR